VLVQKSGYFARSAPANEADLALIRACTSYAVGAALRGESGVVGQDEERSDELRAIEFERIRGGKAFDTSLPWFTELLSDLGQS
jgi:pyrophosphate--fructose-6-phosphate 1-phosphotransferase